MIFITLYHTFLRQVPMLAGLVPPAIIMILYLLWIVYFAKKRKRTIEEVVYSTDPVVPQPVSKYLGCRNLNKTLY